MSMCHNRKEWQTTSLTSNNDQPTATTLQWNFVEDGYVLVEHGNGSTISVEGKLSHHAKNADAAGGTSTKDDLESSAEGFEKLFSPAKAPRLRYSTACVKFMAVAGSAYTSTSKLHATIRQHTLSSPEAQAALDKAQQEASRQQGLIDHRWRELCQATLSLSQQEPFCDSAFDDSGSAISGSSSNAPEDVNSYFRLCREIFLIKERIGELTLDQAASIESIPNPDTAMSMDHFEAKHKELNHALERFQQEMASQREACHTRGINPELYRYRRLSSRQSKKDNVTEWLNRNNES